MVAAIRRGPLERRPTSTQRASAKRATGDSRCLASAGTADPHALLRTFIFRCRYPYLPAALIREAANKYVAAPDAIAPPPHSTGGAIDLRLRYVRGGDLPMTGPPRTDHERVTGAARESRALLSKVMNGAGFSNYEEEWWHWSYGDSGWTLRTNRPEAIFGRTNPPTRS